MGILTHKYAVNRSVDCLRGLNGSFPRPRNGHVHDFFIYPLGIIIPKRKEFETGGATWKKQVIAATSLFESCPGQFFFVHVHTAQFFKPEIQVENSSRSSCLASS